MSGSAIYLVGVTVNMGVHIGRCSSPPVTASSLTGEEKAVRNVAAKLYTGSKLTGKGEMHAFQRDWAAKGIRLKQLGTEWEVSWEWPTGTNDPNLDRIVGYEVIAHMNDGTSKRLHGKGTSQALRRRAMMLVGVQSVGEPEPFTLSQYRRSFGEGRM